MSEMTPDLPDATERFTQAFLRKEGALEGSGDGRLYRITRVAAGETSIVAYLEVLRMSPGSIIGTPHVFPLIYRGAPISYQKVFT